MNLLLDTHAFLWHYSGTAGLSQDVKKLTESPENQLFLSIASLWEISIKNSLGKLELNTQLDVFFADIDLKGYNLLSINTMHILQSSAMPFHHRDPFDRLIIAQSIVESMPVITKDPLFLPYGVNSELKILW
jgi:PIN domain nuclease of toxin-antitoxin system